MANDTVWIIVPVYNAEKTLKKCVKSIQKQTYTNWKLVLVDDGSKDKSGKMCDRFANKDNRIQVLHTANGGSTVARKRGIAQVPDEGYCCFCDSDDKLTKNALKALHNEAEKKSVDMVCGKHISTYKGFKIKSTWEYGCFKNTKVYNKEEIFSEIYMGCFDTIEFPTPLWGKLYTNKNLKRIMLEDCAVPKFYADDLDVLLRLIPTLNSISIIDEITYIYNKGGGTNRFMPTFLEDSCFVYNRKKEYSKFCSQQDIAIRNISNAILSFAISHLIMCERFKKYPCGNLLKEAEYVCNLPEINDALKLLGEDDSGHFIGTGKAFVNKDYQVLADFAYQKAQKRKWKDLFLKILFR